MRLGYEPWLVLLSFVIAMQGAYVGLHLAAQIGGGAGMRRRLLLAGTAFSMATAAWAAHFIAMLAARLPFPVDYLVYPTLLSFLVGVIVLGLAVYAANSGPFGWARLMLAACLMAVGIFSLHVIGTMAADAGAVAASSPLAAAAGMVIAIAGSALALWLANGDRPRLMLSALAFGLAVAGMHFTAAIGATISLRPLMPAGAPVLSANALAIVVTVVSFGLFGLFLLIVMPDHAEAGRQTMKDVLPVGALTENGDETAPAAIGAMGISSDAGLRRGIYAPLGGAGAPPQRIVDQLPIERDGATHFLAVEEVVAVHANAHYTFLFDGTAKIFCPLAIGEVESRLDRSRFMRVHRSHIVNIERVIGTKRSGDGEIVELAADSHYTVPVSRSRAGWLRSRIGKKSIASGLREPDA